MPHFPQVGKACRPSASIRHTRMDARAGRDTLPRQARSRRNGGIDEGSTSLACDAQTTAPSAAATLTLLQSSEGPGEKRGHPCAGDVRSPSSPTSSHLLRRNEECPLYLYLC